MAKVKYEHEAAKPAKAIDIAIEAYQKYPPADWTKAHLKLITDVHSSWKNDLLQAENRYENIASLKYQINNVFTYFQEGDGQAVQYFWDQIGAKDLEYQRESGLAKILKRKKIKDRIEYDNVIDVMLANYQGGKITEEEYALLNKCVEAFERKNSES